MKKKSGISLLLLTIPLFALQAQNATTPSVLSIQSPDSALKVTVQALDGIPSYSVTYQDKTILENSPLGLVTNVGDFTREMTFSNPMHGKTTKEYSLDRSKVSHVFYKANTGQVTFTNAQKRSITVAFQVSNNDVAFRYELPNYKGTTCCVVKSEATGFDFPAGTTTFLTPQSHAMIGFARTKPSYEEGYTNDEPVGTKSQYGHGYTFPGLFHIGDCWALVCETGVTGDYCGSHLSEGTPEGLYTVAYPLEEENNGFGSTGAQISLPGKTPWRTLTVGNSLKPIVETTVMFDVVNPLYSPSMNYKFGRATWHWMLWDDASCNYEDIQKFMDLAADMKFEYTLIDALWDTKIGYDKMESLMNYGKQKGVETFLWYNSNGAWNDAPQGPHNRMSNPINRKKEMKWMQQQGVRGIKVDFWGGDKQETMRLYEQLLSDANEYGIMCIFHGCTLPRGWERMYPNYVGSEAVLASENLKFGQRANDLEAYSACLHPFIRNAVGCMEFGGTILNKRLSRGNDRGTTRRTGDAFQLATAVLFQNPIQNFGLTPNNLTDAPAEAIDFMRGVPTTWDETRFIDGYPGKYVVLARRHADTWYVAVANGTKEDLSLEFEVPYAKGTQVKMLFDEKNSNFATANVKVNKKQKVKLTVPVNGGAVLVGK